MNGRRSNAHKRQDTTTGVAMPREMMQALDELAEERQIYSRSPLIRIAIKEYLERQNRARNQEAIS